MNHWKWRTLFAFTHNDYLYKKPLKIHFPVSLILLERVGTIPLPSLSMLEITMKVLSLQSIFSSSNDVTNTKPLLEYSSQNK